jgi:very-short-patch-repair endonuclease
VKTLRVADLGHSGLTYRAMRWRGWRRFSQGHYIAPDTDDELLTRCSALRAVLPPAAVFSHYTMAVLRHWWLPALPAGLPVFATVPGRGLHTTRAGLYVARSDHASTGVREHQGLMLATATSVLGQLAEDLSILDLVVAIDSALHAGDCTLEELRASIRPRQRGAPRLRRAVAYADPRSESAWETILRLLHVWSGIDVEPQYVVRDDSGRFVARGDLWLRGTKRLHEYDGAGHRDEQQHRRDLRRDKSLARIDWQRYGFTAAEVVGTPVLIIRDAERACGLPHDPTRLRRWTGEVARSSLSPAGRDALAKRLARFQYR